MAPAGTPAGGPCPFLVLVGGAPGSGKTTLALRLAGELRLPLLMRDELKEVLYDTLGAPNRTRSAELGPVSYVLLYAVARRLLEAGVGAILEANFHRGHSEAGLTPLLTGADAVLVHCGGDPSTIVRRFRERVERAPRHPGHHDLDVLPRLQARLTTDIFEPLDLDVPTLRVDTTTDREYAPPFAEIVRFVREAQARAAHQRPGMSSGAKRGAPAAGDGGSAS
jgi:predicted kinase